MQTIRQSFWSRFMGSRRSKSGLIRQRSRFQPSLDRVEDRISMSGLPSWATTALRQAFSGTPTLPGYHQGPSTSSSVSYTASASNSHPISTHYTTPPSYNYYGGFSYGYLALPIGVRR